jgi:hypothetical protein
MRCRLLPSNHPRRFAEVRQSRFARRLLDVPNAPDNAVPCGGISDGAFAGTARCRSTGEPSVPVALVTRYWIAGPGAVPDEIGKAGPSRFNGPVHDALPAFPEKETACRLHDPYVQAPCNVSNVSWPMTANPPDGLPGPSWDRRRMIHILSERGLEPCHARTPDAAGLEAIADAWPDGSLRSLRGMIEAASASGSLRHRYRPGCTKRRLQRPTDDEVKSERCHGAGPAR